MLQWIKQLPTPSTYSLSDKSSVHDENIHSLQKLHFFGKKKGKKSKTVQQIHYKYTGLNINNKKKSNNKNTNKNDKEEMDQDDNDDNNDNNDNKDNNDNNDIEDSDDNNEDDDAKKSEIKDKSEPYISRIKPTDSSPAYTRSKTKSRTKSKTKQIKHDEIEPFYGIIENKQELNILKQQQENCDDTDVKNMIFYEVTFEFFYTYIYYHSFNQLCFCRIYQHINILQFIH